MNNGGIPGSVVVIHLWTFIQWHYGMCTGDQPQGTRHGVVTKREMVLLSWSSASYLGEKLNNCDKNIIIGVGKKTG